LGKKTIYGWTLANTITIKRQFTYADSFIREMFGGHNGLYITESSPAAGITKDRLNNDN
jgi:hypothetical protein